ncbi:MFS transporter [Streptomyces sp. NBC_01239]|uniref:MFS transporter n=1 Tax=Streptomyces sp. NBC_01239 TaxID=2903792 RepID=UPI00224F1F4D|nr:MFS transporter [Streptomyces sp. NBC_01239]MCX4810383.1 MFS transporter [Streptomyces sp. NBC_01239]
MTSTLIAPGTAIGKPAHRDPNVLRWLAAYTSSMVGDSVYYIALSWAAVQQGSPAQAGAVMAVSAVPRALLMLGGGVIADRFGPRRVVIGSDLVRCAAGLSVAALLFLTSPGLWPLALLAVVFGTVDAVFMPAVGALPARVTTRDQLARVQGMRGLAIRFASVVGGPLGGLAVALGGAAAAFGLAGLLIAVSVPLLISVRMRELAVDDKAEAGGGSADAGDAGDAGEGAGGRGAAPGAAVLGAPDSEARGAPAPAPAPDKASARPTTPLGDLKAGLRYIRAHRVLAPLMLAIALGDLGFVGPLNVGLTLLADERGWGASGMGWVLSGFGVGAGAAALLLTVRGRLPHAGHVAGWAILAGSVAIGALAFVPGVPAAVGVALLVGLLAGLSGALCGALLQTQADPAYLGRVTAVSSLVSLGFAPLSMPLSAAAIGAWGTGPVFVGSAAVCGLGGVVALCVRDLRRAELPG